MRQQMGHFGVNIRKHIPGATDGIIFIEIFEAL